MRNRDLEDGGRIAERIRRFGEIVASESPLYGRLSAGVADEPIVHRILADTGSEQPPANILFAAVHLQLSEHRRDPLARHYPSLGAGDDEPDDDPVTAFLDFCHRHEAALSQLAAVGITQTNEVRRCVGLLPACAAAGRVEPLALLEIGPSAGLNLAFDRYHYDYGDLHAGPTDSPLTLTTELRTGTLPGLDPMPDVVWRRGIDRNPIDLSDDDAVRWLRALLWPEQIERIKRFDRAVSIVRDDPPVLIEGDGTEMLMDVADSAPADVRLIIFHTFVLNQFSSEERAELDSTLRRLSHDRPLSRIGIDLTDPRSNRGPTIRLWEYAGGDVSETALGRMHHHGAWLQWSPQL